MSNFLGAVQYGKGRFLIKFILALTFYSWNIYLCSDKYGITFIMCVKIFVILEDINYFNSSIGMLAGDCFIKITASI